MRKKKKTLGLPKHQAPSRGDHGRLPEWALSEKMAKKNPCLVSVADDAYHARGRAMDDHRAQDFDQCQQLLNAAEKSLRVLNDPKASIEKRCAEGDRAARKFWEAKVCARRLKGG